MIKPKLKDMKKLSILFVSAMLMATVGCKNEKKDVEKEVETVIEEVKVEEIGSKKVTMTLESRSESTATGTVVFSEIDGEVSMNANLSGLTPGMHAIHIHEKADCSAADATSSGGHWNPTAKNHGKWGDATGYHKGDIGNFEADADGTGFVSMSTNEWCLGCDDPSKDIMGKAIVVHRGVDDFTSQPSGAAGARVSCGGIIQ